MSREDELAMIRQQMSVAAERISRMVEVISIKTRAGHNTALAEQQLALLETMMWRLHRHAARVKARRLGFDAPGRLAPTSPATEPRVPQNT